MAVQLTKKENYFIMKKTKLMVAGLMMGTMLLGGVSSAYAADSTGTVDFTQNTGGGDRSHVRGPLDFGRFAVDRSVRSFRRGPEC